MGCADGSLKTLHGHASAVWSVSFSLTPAARHWTAPQRRSKFLSSTLECERWSVSESLAGASGLGSLVHFSPEGQLASGRDGSIRLWDVETGRCLRTLEGHAGGVWSIRFSPDGRKDSGSYDKTIRLWNVKDGQCLNVFQGPTGWVLSVCFSPNGQISQ